ncbi:MAG: type II secretion system protein N [Rubrivivax sp.]|nr:type II secretion system protein N [Rubrivivax sp.]
MSRPLISSLRRWAVAGGLLGAIAGGLMSLPAAWLAGGVARATQGQFLLADARGTVWSGSAVAVLSAGADSRTAVALPGRLGWSLGWADGAFELRARQACCLRGEPRLRLRPGFGAWQFELKPSLSGGSPGGPAAALIGQWPAAWLAGLGTPWNTLKLDGALRLSTGGLRVDLAEGRWQLAGDAVLDLQRVASRLSTLPVLGSYRLDVTAGDAGARLTLATLSGALRLSGDGSWDAGGLRLRGEATAAAGAEAALDNLLNIIGRRQGARSIIAIG